MLCGSCHLILFVSSTNSIQIVRRQCSLAVVTNMSYEQNQYKNYKSSSEACFDRKRRRKHQMHFLSQEMDHNSIHGPPHKSKPPPLVRTRGPIFTGNRLFSSTSYVIATGYFHQHHIYWQQVFFFIHLSHIFTGSKKSLRLTVPKSTQEYSITNSTTLV